MSNLCLDVVVENDETWAPQIRQRKFQMHNKEWLEVIDEDEFNRSDRPFSAYVLWVSRSHIIIGEGPKANHTRFINHSDEPNAFLVVSTRWKTARFEALRDIQACEEIFFDYGEDYWE